MTESNAHGLRGIFIILVVFVCAMSIAQGWQASRNQPNQTQRIAAIIVSWGVDSPAMHVPVNQQDVDDRLEKLRSPVSEERVQAAHWLAAHGVRDASAAIASAMRDPATRRPCQLAHALGQLGRARWTDELVRAAQQPANRDLRVCATDGLKQLGSARAIDPLIQLAERGTAQTIAIEALGVVGDSRAAPALRRIVSNTQNDHVREAARRALQRIDILGLDDPLPELLRSFEQSLHSDRPSQWALRHLARLGDARAAPVLANALESSSVESRDRESIAACLFACGEAGRLALERCAKNEKTPAAGVARSALALLQASSTPTDPRYRSLASSQ